MRTILAALCLSVLWSLILTAMNQPWTLKAASAQEKEERELFIHIHSGLKTLPVRKVIGAIINEAEGKGVKEIVGSGKHVEWDVWDISLVRMKDKETKEYKWRYGREEWNIQPMNEEARGLHFPLDKYVFGPAINMSLGMIEGQGIVAEEVLGRAEKPPDGQWQFSLKAVDPKGISYTQKWLYNPATGDLFPQHFDHSELDRVLAHCVTPRGIDYTVLKKNVHLKNFLKQASKVYKKELEAFPREEQIAFWINVYNATVLKWVAEKFPVKSVKDIKGFFNKKKVKIAGKAFTLNDLRNYLLEDFKEKRVLFALVSGTKSSPPLRREAYCGRLLDRQLDDNLAPFLNNPANLYVTEVGVLLSPVLEPLEKEGTLRDFLKGISGFLPPDISKSLMGEKKEIKFMRYDWGLNAAE